MDRGSILGSMVLLAIIALVCTCCFYGCQTQYTEWETGEVSRVFMHEPGSYSILDGNLHSISFRRSWPRVKTTLVADVPKGEKMWWKGRKSYDWGNAKTWCEVEIHIHGPEDINGGDWQEGAGGGRRSGQTRVVK